MFERLFGKKKALKFEYQCTCCGKIHRNLPALAQGSPPVFSDVPEVYRDDYAKVSDDLCKIDPYPEAVFNETMYFIRGTFDMPIIGYDDTLSLGLWFSQSAASFQEYVSTFSEDQSNFASFAWTQPDSIHFKDVDEANFLVSTPCDLYGGKSGQRPFGVAHADAETRIARNQRDGISPEAVVSIMTNLFHPDLP